jgi:beta-N-acetylhexosaminidase
LIILPKTKSISMAADANQHTDTFVEHFRKRHANIETISISHLTTQEQHKKIDTIAGHFAMIIIVTVNANLDAHQKEIVQHLIQTGTPLIGLAILNPYDLLAFPQLQTYLVSYEYTSPALAATVRVLFGESEAKGRLPISLPGLHPLLRT